MKNYCLLIILAIFAVQHSDAAEQRHGRRMPTEAGPALEEEEKELKERDAQKQEQGLETPEELVALWMAQRQQELQEQELVDEQLFEPKRFSRKPQEKHYLSELGGAGALREFHKAIQKHFEPIPTFPGIAKTFRVDTGNQHRLGKNNVAISADGRMIAIALVTREEDGFTGIETTVYKITDDAKLEVLERDRRVTGNEELQYTMFLPNHSSVVLETLITQKRFARPDASYTYFFKFNPTTGPIGISKPHRVEHLTFSPNGLTMAASLGNTIWLYNINLFPNKKSKKPEDTFQKEPVRSLTTKAPIQNLAFSPDGSNLVAKMANNTTISWNSTTWAASKPQKPKILDLQQAARSLDRPFFPNISPQDGIVSHTLSVDGTYLALGAEDGSIRLSNRKTGEPRAQILPGNSGAILSVAFWPDAPYLTAVAADGTVTLWNIGALQNKLETAMKLLKNFLGTLSTNAQRAALREIITQNESVALVPLLYWLHRDDRAEAAAIIDMQPAARGNFTAKNLDDLQGIIFQKLLRNDYKFLDN